jgi:hypothetical protein
MTCEGEGVLNTLNDTERQTYNHVSVVNTVIDGGIVPFKSLVCKFL